MPLTRKELLTNTFSEEYDLLVIGGGITGCGIALDASLRGLRTILIEKNDFASGTSSRSTKLIHGGLRYLKQLELKLVKDVGRERAIVYKNAMHIVRPEKMLLPIIKNGSLSKQSSSLGLFVYDVLAGVKSGERRKMLCKEETLKQEPLLDETKLTGGGLYYEYRTDDARLVIELAKSAIKEGAICLNYCKAENFVYNNERLLEGVNVTDMLSGEAHTIKANKIVNACGPGVDLIRKSDQSLYGKRLQLTKGVHLVFPYDKIPLKQSAYFDVEDGRMIFAIPRDGITYVGTTDTVYNQDIDNPLTTKEDVVYLIKAVNDLFPTLKLVKEDIVSSWAGLRPLIYEEGKSASELSRKDEIIISESGLISIAGGKLTGYRLMAEKIVDLIQKKLHHSKKVSSSTRIYNLSGCDFSSESQLRKHIESLPNPNNLDKEVLEKWVYKYGSNTNIILQIFNQNNNQTKDQKQLAILAELQYCIDYEMVLSINDFAIRRSGMLYFNIEDLKKYKEDMLVFLSKKLNWKEDRVKTESQLLERALTEATSFN